MAEMIHWVIENELARSSRPGYLSFQPSSSDMDKWLKSVREMHIRSVVCLLEERELSYYSHLRLHKNGLLGWYADKGLAVVHIPVEDHAGIPLNQHDLQQVWGAFQSLDKPLLVHCSAGIDRTGAAVRYIAQQLNTK